MTEPSPKPARPRPRFRCGMRLLLSLLVFDMVFRSLGVLLPHEQWREEIRIETLPQRPPTLREMDELAAKATEADPCPVTDRWMESADSAWDFLKPWPSAAVRATLAERLRCGECGWELGGKFAFCWLITRLGFVENLAGVNQDWQMFSPNVSKGKDLIRWRLEFADGSHEIHRIGSDPADLTRYSHWWEEKIILAETSPRRWTDARYGYANYLRHLRPANDAGSPLARIVMFEVRYEYPGPDVDDPAEFLRRQSGPPADQIRPDVWEFDVATKTGRRLDRKP